MPRIRWTPSPTDASKYGLDGPQVFDTDEIRDLPSSKLEELEAVLRRHAGLNIADVYPARDGNLKIPRAVMWMTLRLAGHGLDWDDFDPQVLRAEFEEEVAQGGDANPPADTPDETSSPEE